ncbi:MAG: CDGSH iron-sulfur domain-containing protein [candidate division Zixibacteria bacterium]
MDDSTLQITIIANGPARIKCTKAEITLANGTTITKEKPFSLCRCGKSDDKPFCDGTHTTCGFKG